MVNIGSGPCAYDQLIPPDCFCKLNHPGAGMRASTLHGVPHDIAADVPSGSRRLWESDPWHTVPLLQHRVFLRQPFQLECCLKVRAASLGLGLHIVTLGCCIYVRDLCDGQRGL